MISNSKNNEFVQIRIGYRSVSYHKSVNEAMAATRVPLFERALKTDVVGILLVYEVL